MKTVGKMAAQGDFLIRRIDALPTANLVEMDSVKGFHTVAHSETGHNHVMAADNVTALKDRETSDDKLFSLFLEVTAPTEITHLRDHDTHETLLVPAGTYEIRRQREYVAGEFRRAAD